MTRRFLTILAVLTTACSDRSPGGPVEPAPPGTRSVSASGAVFMLNGMAPGGLQVTLDGAPRVSAPVNADGSFAIEGLALGDSVSLIIDVAQGAGRSVLPALVRVPSRTGNTGLRVVLVPTRWTVEAGTYAGTTVDVSVDAAFRRPCSDTSNTNCDGFYPPSWLNGVKIWTTTSLPVRLALDHGRTHVPFTAADSAALWDAVRRMNDDAGLPLFRAARAEELGLSAAGVPSDGVVVRVDTTLAGFAAWANWWWNANGEMYAGVVRTRDMNAFRNARLMTHELLHTHGIKHSCSWGTVMGGYGCSSTAGLSVHDVAYFQLARRVHEAQRANAAPHGLVAALQGERVALHGLPFFALPAPARLAAMRADSIADGEHAH